MWMTTLESKICLMEIILRYGRPSNELVTGKYFTRYRSSFTFDDFAKANNIAAGP